MAYDKVLEGRVRAALLPQGDVAERRMMGGMCFMVKGHMCCGVSGDLLMVRVGRENYEAALSEPHVRPLELGGRRPIGYVRVERAGFASDADLHKWLNRALATVATLPPK